MNTVVTTNNMMACPVCYTQHVIGYGCPRCMQQARDDNLTKPIHVEVEALRARLAAARALLMPLAEHDAAVRAWLEEAP